MTITLSDRWDAFLCWWYAGWPGRAIAAFCNPNEYVDVAMRRSKHWMY